jgi:hypothetical protein
MYSYIILHTCVNTLIPTFYPLDKFTKSTLIYFMIHTAKIEIIPCLITDKSGCYNQITADTEQLTYST